MALRKAREKSGLTQAQVAEATDWSLSKVMRIESGDVGISATDLRALFDLYDITDGPTREKLAEDARASRRQRYWWTDPRYRAHLTPATLQLLQYQADAAAIRNYQNVLVPGLFQNEEYAREIFRSGELSEEDIEVRVEARIRRATTVLDRSDPAMCYTILDESVLYREVGGPKVMGQQLMDLLTHMERPNVLVRVVPFAAAAPIALFGPFVLIDLGDEDGSVLYRESVTDEIVHAPALVKRHKGMFEQLWELALGDAESTDLILRRARAMLSGESSDAPG